MSRLAKRAKASWGYAPEWMAAWEEDLTISASYIRSHRVIVADAEGRVLGLVAVEDGPEGPEVGHLWVEPEAQGRGVGRALMSRAVEIAEKEGWTALRIVSDPYAQPFYERLGAVQVGEVPAPVCGIERVLPLLRLSIDRGP